MRCSYDPAWGCCERVALWYNQSSQAWTRRQECVTSSMCVIRKNCLSLGQLIALQTIVFLESVVTCLTVAPNQQDQHSSGSPWQGRCADEGNARTGLSSCRGHAWCIPPCQKPARKRAKTAQGRGEPPRHRPHPIPGVLQGLGPRNGPEVSMVFGDAWKSLDLPWFASTISLNYLNLVTICWENTLSFSAGPGCRWLFAATAIHLRRPRLKVVAIAMPYSLWCLILSFGTLSLSHCVLLSPTIDRPWDGLVAACCGTPWCNVVVPGWTKNWLTCGYTLVQSTWTSRLNCRLVPRLGSCWIAAESKGRVCRANKCKLSIVYHSIPCVSMFFH